RRIPVRLVKGAYWDSEVKRAQVDGLAGYPVFTRKPNTDVSYQANAARLLSGSDAIYPMFATHNAQTIAAIHRMAQALLPGTSPFGRGRNGAAVSGEGPEHPDASGQARPPSRAARHPPPEGGGETHPHAFQKPHRTGGGPPA